MKKILVTGGFGFVGGRLVKKLSANMEVLVSSRKEVLPEVLHLHGIKSQILHEELLNKDSFPKEIDTVIHLAALNEWNCVKFPSEAIRVNIDETRMVLENAMVNGVKNFIYFSTAHIYGSPLTGIKTEESLPVPVHPYAITHKAAEDYIIAAQMQKKINATIIRLSNSFGSPVLPTVNRWTLLVNDLCRQAIEKGSLTLLSNGCQFRDFVCLTDVECCIDKLIKHPQNFKKTIYNLGSGVSVRVIDMATYIAELYSSLFNKPITIILPAGSVSTKEPQLLYSNRRLLNEGCSIRNDVDTELKELLQFCHQNFSKID